MNNAKDIAEKILNCETYDIPDIQSLARAYLELKKRIVLLLRENTLLILDSIEPRTDKDVTIVGLKKESETERILRKSAEDTAKDFGLEITKLKEENETLSKDLKMCREIGVEMQREVNRKLSVENDNLKKSRDVLRKSLKDLSLPLTRTDYTVGQLDKITCDIAENSLKADDEIMGG